MPRQRKNNLNQTPDILVGEPIARKQNYLSSIIFIILVFVLLGLVPYFLWSAGKNKNDQISFNELKEVNLKLKKIKGKVLLSIPRQNKINLYLKNSPLGNWEEINLNSYSISEYVVSPDGEKIFVKLNSSEEDFLIIYLNQNDSSIKINQLNINKIILDKIKFQEFPLKICKTNQYEWTPDSNKIAFLLCSEKPKSIVAVIDSNLNSNKQRLLWIGGKEGESEKGFIGWFDNHHLIIDPDISNKVKDTVYIGEE